ncbi:TRSP domain-containing protein [Yinghuangia aomiensis]
MRCRAAGSWWRRRRHAAQTGRPTNTASATRAKATARHGAAVPPCPAPVRASVLRLDLDWPAGLPDGGRHGFTPGPPGPARCRPPRPRRAGRCRARRGPAGARALGFEELMYVPLRLARALADALPEAEVRYSTTTRSPVLAVDDPGYAIRTRLDFPAHDDPADGPGPRYAYNVDPGADAARRFDTIAVVLDSTADTAALHADGGACRPAGPG